VWEEEFMVNFGTSEPAGKGTLFRTLTVLRFVAANDRPVGASEVARRTCLPKSTAHRMLTMLTSEGALRRIGARYLIDEGNGWPIGVENAAWARLRSITKPFLVDLFQRTGHIAGIYVLNGQTIRCVDILYTRSQAGIAISTEERLTVDGTAAGRLLLAYSPITVPRADLEGELALIRECGVASYLRGGWPTIRELAAPIFDRNGCVVAALGIAGPSAQIAERSAGRVLRAIAHSASVDVRRGYGYRASVARRVEVT
jgi:DNA-binding IclR family transcriptional regulator